MGGPRDEHLWKGEEGSRRWRGRIQTKCSPNSSLAEARSHPRTRMVLLSFWSWAEMTGIYTQVLIIHWSPQEGV